MVFKLDGRQTALVAEWLEGHDKDCPYYDDGASPISPSGAIGGRISYSFTPTGLGVITVVECACGDTRNLTDFDNW